MAVSSRQGRGVSPSKRPYSFILSPRAMARLRMATPRGAPAPPGPPAPPRGGVGGQCGPKVQGEGEGVAQEKAAGVTAQPLDPFEDILLGLRAESLQVSDLPHATGRLQVRQGAHAEPLVNRLHLLGTEAGAL